MPDLGSDATRRSTRRIVSALDIGGEEDGKLAAGGKKKYPCRFCDMTFEKSQALGGHMNRHRPEREREQLQQAQLIVSNGGQHQMPRTWSSLSAEIIQGPSGLNGSGATTAQRLSSHLSGGAIHQQYVVPPISFGTLYRPTSPANCNPGTPLPPLPGSNCNFYMPSNASSCNLPSNNTNMQNQHNQQQLQQLQQWLGSMDGFSNAAINSPRSTPRSGSGSFQHHLAENIAISFPTAGLPTEVLANMLRNSGTSNDGSPLVSPSTPTSTPTSSQAQTSGTYDIVYNSQLANAFYNSGI